MNTTQLPLLQHGKNWDGRDLTGWFISEKLDGVRAYWNGELMLSRQGKEISIPDDWRSALPVGVKLDGELYNRNGLKYASNAARYGDKHFNGCEYIVFDTPNATGNWLSRLKTAQQFIGAGTVRVIGSCVAQSTQHAIDALRQVVALGGEGLMVRAPGIGTEPGRTDQLLKLKIELAEQFI
jgi:DNA ligase 1